MNPIEKVIYGINIYYYLYFFIGLIYSLNKTVYDLVEIENVLEVWEYYMEMFTDVLLWPIKSFND